MFVRISGENLIYCDYARKCIRVATDTPLIPGYHGTFREIGKFETPEEWKKSRFASQVTDEEVQNAIDWFWVDVFY